MAQDFDSTFFDQLPDDIHDPIAYYLFSSVKTNTGGYNIRSLTDDQYLETLLEYAKNSSSRREATMRAMGNYLAPSIGWKAKTVTDWISICAGEIRELDLVESPTLSFPWVPRLLELRKASIKSAPDQIALIRESPSLEQLTVTLQRPCFWDHLVSAIGSIPLRYLHLKFDRISCQSLNVLSKIQLMSLCAACPEIEHLILEGPSHSCLKPIVWKMMTRFRSLKKIGFPAQIEDQYLPFLQTISDIELFGLKPGIPEKTETLSTRVTGLFLRHQVRHEDIVNLGSFPNLRALSIYPLRSQESALIGVIDNVEELRLSWIWDCAIHSANERPGGPDLPTLYASYHEPDAEVLADIMRSAKNLKSLSIEKAAMKVEVIEKILEIVGDKLEIFEVCNDWQGEPAAPRIEGILKAVAQYCPNLRTLGFVEVFTEDLPILGTEEQKRCCLRALLKIKEAVPKFMSYRYIRCMIENRFTDKRPENVLLWDDVLPDS